MRKSLFVALLFVACSCSKSDQRDSSTVVSMQVIDRHGFSETISSKERLEPFQKVDFLEPQAYNRVLRVYGKNSQGKSPSAITSYHPNGQVEQYLEVLDGRAHGKYKAWHSNGKLKLDVTVIEGLGDITEMAQASWLFDGKSSAWNEEGNLIAEIFYDKGVLSGDSLYYHDNGKLSKSVPFKQGEVDGVVKIYNSEGLLVEQVSYAAGIKQGLSEGFWNEEYPSYREEYQKGLLQKGSYFDRDGILISEIKDGAGTQALFASGHLYSVTQYAAGAPDGLVQIFHPNGTLDSTFYIRDGKKNGEEIYYYAAKDKKNEPPKKLSLIWRDDVIQGVATTWYENGAMESQREMENNKKHGISFAWYESGDLMLMEEYKEDVLAKGSYYKKGEKLPITKIENGEGIATLYDPTGHFLKKISYEKGKPLLDSK